ncbi:hypothetical protein PR202_gb13571 [Eleusine coracana subsp. coracana]|uniref:F-box domain-containing protein n=1 Tax=Eleusine coracana subsp. coracana TaxID=191504 RepID=A0AAV5EQQ0_ELECO|nr:hypothetical protein PR202_gb13571 [Eleusine coracana subsp. coracana]
MMKPACASGGTSLVASEPDRLSALPDCLLHTIMSFLKARQVVQTCVLSTRWRHLWCSVPCLDIDIDEFNTGSGLSYLGVPHNDKNWEDFEDFAVNLMLHITLKSLVIDGGSNSYDDYLVITAPSVANLHLAVDVVCFHAGISLNEMPCLDKASILLLGNRERGMESKLGRDQFKLLCSLSTVVSLELSNLMTMVFSEECTTTCKQFKNLRNLLLENCDVSDDFQTMALFLETSPHLEKLTLRHCTISNGTKKWISSQCRSLNVLRANLKLTKIIYKDDVCQLVQHFVHNSENLPNNQFEFRKVD